MVPFTSVARLTCQCCYSFQKAKQRSQRPLYRLIPGVADAVNDLDLKGRASLHYAVRKLKRDEVEGLVGGRHAG